MRRLLALIMWGYLSTLVAASPMVLVVDAIVAPGEIPPPEDLGNGQFLHSACEFLFDEWPTGESFRMTATLDEKSSDPSFPPTTHVFDSFNLFMTIGGKSLPHREGNLAATSSGGGVRVGFIDGLTPEAARYFSINGNAKGDSIGVDQVLRTGLWQVDGNTVPGAYDPCNIELENARFAIVPEPLGGTLGLWAYLALVGWRRRLAVQRRTTTRR